MRHSLRATRLAGLASALSLGALGLVAADLRPRWVSAGAALAVQALLLAVVAAQALYGGVALLDPRRALAKAAELPAARAGTVLAELDKIAAWLIVLGNPYALAAWSLTGASWPLVAVAAAALGQVVWYGRRVRAVAHELDRRVDPPRLDATEESAPWPG